jgi:hypothetical protein
VTEVRHDAEFLLDAVAVFGFARVLQNEDFLAALDQESDGTGTTTQAP